MMSAALQCGLFSKIQKTSKIVIFQLGPLGLEKVVKNVEHFPQCTFHEGQMHELFSRIFILRC